MVIDSTVNDYKVNLVTTLRPLYLSDCTVYSRGLRVDTVNRNVYIAVVGIRGCGASLLSAPITASSSTFATTNTRTGPAVGDTRSGLDPAFLGVVVAHETDALGLVPRSVLVTIFRVCDFEPEAVPARFPPSPRTLQVS